jgi:hypothetical protein
MGARYLHNNMTGGAISPSLHSRTGIDKYSSSVAVAENVVISPYGGLRRRQGLNKHKGSYLGAGEFRIMPFVASTDENYLLVFEVDKCRIYKDGTTLKATVDLVFTYEGQSIRPISTNAILYAFDYAQYLDTAIIVYEDFPPFQIQRDALNDTVWTLSVMDLKTSKYSFTNEPQPDYRYINTGEPLEPTVLNGDIVLNLDGDDENGVNEAFYRNLRTADTDIRLDREDYTNTANWQRVQWGEDVFSLTRGFPNTVCFFQQRLWFGGTKSLGTAVFGSKINGYFDFRLGDGESDYGIFDIIETGDYNKIVNMNAGRVLQVFTTAREFINVADYITPTDSSWREQTSYGSKRIKPINIDGSSLFVDNSGRSIRSLIYSLEEDGHISPTITLTANHLITEVKSMAAVKGTLEDVSDFLYVVNTDGTAAVWNTNRLENISGWTRWTTNGKFIDVAVMGEAVYFSVERNGSVYVERLDEDCYTDHATVVYGTPADSVNVTFDTNNVTFGGENVVFTEFPNGGKITTLDTDLVGNVGFMPMAMTLDFNVQSDITVNDNSGTNAVTLPRGAIRAEVGLNFESKIETLPEAPDTKAGNYINKEKRFGQVIVDYLDTIGGTVNQVDSPTRYFIAELDGGLQKFTGIKPFRFLGYARRLSLQVEQTQPLPFYVRSIEIEVIY